MYRKKYSLNEGKQRRSQGRCLLHGTLVFWFKAPCGLFREDHFNFK